MGNSAHTARSPSLLDLFSYIAFSYNILFFSLSLSLSIHVDCYIHDQEVGYWLQSDNTDGITEPELDSYNTETLETLS